MMSATKDGRILAATTAAILIAASSTSSAAESATPFFGPRAGGEAAFVKELDEALGAAVELEAASGGGPGAKCTSAPKKTSIPWRAKPGQTHILFPDVNMFRPVHDWNRLLNASHGIVGMKVWQAGYGVDHNFRENLRQASRRKMIVIGYIFGIGGVRGEVQADLILKHFLLNSLGKPIPGRAVALDLEYNPHGRTMTVGEAKAFVARFHKRTGRYPILYTNGPRPGILARCLRWIPSFGDKPSWPAIWQFTDGKYGPGPHSFPGVGNCDINRTYVPYRTIRRWAGL